MQYYGMKQVLISFCIILFSMNCLPNGRSNISI